MPGRYPPAVFLSSTCYDLSQLRVNLENFLRNLGLDPVLSEYSSFPVDPTLSTVENCLRNVRERADILVLVVGGRYGSTTHSEKSITNLEYLEARRKAIPIYVFISSPIISNLSVWRANPEADFGSVVDSNHLFEFAEALRTTDGTWVFPFDNAHDIEKVLRTQFALLFSEGLSVLRKLRANPNHKALANLSASALRFAVEREPGWEYLLLAQILLDEFERRSDLLYDMEHDISLEGGKAFDEIPELMNWMSIKIRELIPLPDTMSRLINDALPKSVGSPGESGDVEHILYVGTRFAESYEATIRWSLGCKNLDVPEQARRLVELYKELPQMIISNTRTFVQDFYKEVTSKIPESNASGEPMELKFTVVFELPDMTEFNAEMERLKSRESEFF